MIILTAIITEKKITKNWFLNLEITVTI